MLDCGNPEFEWQLDEEGPSPEPRPRFLAVTAVDSESGGGFVGVTSYVVPQKVIVSATPHQSHFQPAAAAADCSEAIRAALKERSSEPVVITARVSKTDSFAQRSDSWEHMLLLSEQWDPRELLALREADQ